MTRHKQGENGPIAGTRQYGTQDKAHTAPQSEWELSEWEEKQGTERQRDSDGDGDSETDRAMIGGPVTGKSDKRTNGHALIVALSPARQNLAHSVLRG